MDKKVPRQSWISDRTMDLSGKRDSILKRIKSAGRSIQRRHTQIGDMATNVTTSVSNGSAVMGALNEKTLTWRKEREELAVIIPGFQSVVKASAGQDRADFVVSSFDFAETDRGS